MSQSNSNYTLSSSPVSSSGMWDEVASRVSRHHCSLHISQSADTFPSPSQPRSSASTTSTCGMVVLPNGTPFFVNDKEAYFAANPAARASTQASLRDFGAWSTQDDRAREYEERVKAEKAAKKEREMEDAGLHGCVAGKMLTRCGECAGNGR